MKMRNLSFFQLGTLMLLFSISCGLSLPDTNYDSLKVGSVAPDFSLQSSSDTTIRLSSLRGKIVMVNFWASWCGPCKDEMPAIQNVFSKYSENLIILGVNDEDTISTIRDFAKQFELTFPLLIDSTGSVSAQYKIRAYPSTIFVDRDGFIFYIAVGSMAQSDIEDILREKISLEISSEQENNSPSQTPAQLSSIEGCVSAGALNVRTEPSLESEVADWLYRDECYLFDARSSDSYWLRLASTWQGKGKWVSAKYIILKEQIDYLPISE
jgi:peroxiredoxin